MATVETLAPGTKTMRRRSALEPYLVKLDAAVRRLPPEGAPSLKVTIGETALLIEPWVVSRTDPRNAAPDDELDRTELLRQSLALWLKSSIDVGNLREISRGGSGSLYGLQAELMLDSAFGSALLRELQDSVDGMVKAGELEEAKRFSKFQHQMRCVVREMKQSIAESNGKRADELVEQLTDHQPAPAPSAERPMRETEPETNAPRRRRRPPAETAAAEVTGSTRPRYRTEILIALDVVALLVFFFVTGPTGRMYHQPRALTRGDFPNAAPLTELIARPPALYATIDEATWSGFDDKQKHRFIDSMGSVLLTKGYVGLLLKTSDGRVVGEWLETGGTRLVDVDPIAHVASTDPASPAPAAAADAAAQYSRFVP